MQSARTRSFTGVPGRKINLTFHGIGEPERPLEQGEGRFWIGRDQFESVLDAVAGRPDVRLTFDDGNASDVVYALPGLRERDLTAVFFIVAGRLGQPGFLDEADVRTLAAAGMRIGCHGMTHRRWPSLDGSALREELSEAKHMLEQVVGRPITEAACPFGAYNRRVLRQLRRHGYRRAYTSDAGTAPEHAWLQVRNTVCRDDAAAVEQILAPSDDALSRRARRAVKRWL